MTIMVEIPQDIIELIVDHISLDFSSSDAQCALLACTSVSQSFRYPARRALFSTVTLEAHPAKPPTITNPTEHIGTLCDLLCRNVEIKPLVRHLHIQVDDRRTILQDDDNLSRVINLLAADAPLLETIWITGYRRRPFEWDNMGPLTKAAIVNLLGQGRLKNLRLSNILGVPPLLIQHCDSLCSVEFIHTTFDPAPSLLEAPTGTDEPLQKAAWTRLRSLTVHGYIFHFDSTFLNPSFPSTYLSTFLALIKFKGLIRDRMGVNALSHIVQTAAASLTQLTLMIRVDTALLSLSSLNLADLPKLDSLTMCVQTGTLRSIPPLHHVFSLLTPHQPSSTPRYGCPSVTTLRHLCITINALAPPRAPQSITRAHSAATYAPALRSSFSLDPFVVNSSTSTWTVFDPDSSPPHHYPQSRMDRSSGQGTRSHWVLIRPSILKEFHPLLQSVHVTHDFKLPSNEAKDVAQMKLARRVLELELGGVFEGFELDAQQAGVKWHCLGVVS